MRRILLFLLGVIASITIVNAGKVTEQQALQKAQQFMKGKTLSKANTKSLSRGRSSDDAFYVFNAENDGGFVIVAGDDRVPAILGYSDTGKMDMGHLPENVQHWLEGYAAQVRSVSEGKSTARNRGTRAALAPIEPLIKTQWSQGEPFNRMCPYLGGDRCVTGCVATALAQILYYYRWPESVASLPAYTTSTKHINMPELPATTFNYDLMQTTYSWDESENIPSREEVAKLLRYCGQSLEMDYDLGGSGAGLSTEVLKEYYQYSWRAHWVLREEYPDDVWDAMMYEELQNGCPIPYDGFSNNGGHQFILDGYKDGLFHINWGWGGWCDGYFILALANSTQPEYTATEGEYSEGQGAILGVVPARYEKKATVDGLQYVCDTKEMTAVVINGDYDEMTEVVIPASIQFEGKTYIVTEIANNAFEYCWDLQRLDLPSTLKVIGDCAFLNCKNLSTVVCRMENPLDINENVFTIIDWFSDEETGEWSKTERFSKATLYVPEGTSAKYQEAAVWKKFPQIYEGELKEITVDGLNYSYVTGPKFATVLAGDYSALETVVIPSSITVDGVDYQVKFIADNAFRNSNSLKSLTLSEGLEKIGNSAFYGCSEIEHLVIPEGLKVIGNNAFSECYNIKRLNLPSSLTTIDEKAFYGMSALTAVKVAALEPLTINENVFSYTEWVKKEDSDEWESFEEFSKATLYVPEGTSSKYQEAAVWKKFPQIYEGDLKETTIDGLNYSYVTGSKVATVLAGDYSALETVVIPSSITVDGVKYQVKFISDNAFQNYSSIKSLTLSVGLEKIGNSAFSYCSGIEYLVIPEGVKVIGNNAFSGCYNLKRLDLPSSLTDIGEYAFYDMSNLSSVVAAALEPLTINENVFLYYQSVYHEDTGEWDWIEVFSQATLYVPEGTSSKYQEAAVWKKFPQIYEGDLKTTTVDGLNYSYVTGSKFATVLAGDYSAMETVVIPSTITVDGVEYKVKAIEDKAFYDCYSMKSLTLSVGLEKIGFSAFRYCSGIKQLVIPEGVKTIGSYAFSSCSYLEQLYLPSSLTDIGEYAFYDMSNLSSVIAAALEPLTINENVFLYYQSVYHEDTGEWDWIEVFSQATLYVPEGTSSKYQEAPVWKEFGDIIEKAMAEGSVVPPTAITGLVYSGTAQYLINAGSSDTGIIQYSIDDTDYSTDIPQVTDAKEYTVYYKVITQEGLINVYPASLKVTIAPKAISSPVITLSQTSYEYDGTAQEPTVTVKDGETTIPASNYTVSYQDNIEVGIATVIVTNTDDGNYIFSGSTTFEITAPDIPIPDEEVITISGALQVPYYSAYNLDFTDKPELRAYVATGYDKSTGVIWLTRVKQVPAETGFLLMGDPGDYDIPTIDGVSDVYYKNMFKGTLEGTTLYTTDGDYTNYYLSKGDAGVGFYKVTKEDGVKVGANRCYLPILTEIPANGSTGDTELIKVSAAKQVPYYTSKNLDFSSLDAQGVKAYTATGYNYSTGVIWLTRVKKVPAKTGILVMADKEGEYNVPTASVQSVYENMFVGSETAQTIYTTETVGDIEYINYYLSNGTSGVGFYKVTNENGQKMGANRSYLQIPKREKASGARGMDGHASFCRMVISDNDDDVIAIPVYGGMGGDDEGTTGIISTQFQNAEQDVYYNLQGQRIDRPRKGVYIKNGKMVIVR